jgi:hypothetical protein
VVNRAARFVQAVDDGRVVVDATTAGALGEAFVCSELAPEEHRGLGELRWFAVSGAAGAPR